MKKFVEVFFQLHPHEPLQHKIIDWAEGLSVSSVLNQLEELNSYPELFKRQVGIYGKIVSLSHFVQPGDRIEIYAPLQIDPKEARRLRVVKKKR